MDGYRTIRGTAIEEYTEKRSRFIAASTPVQSEEEALAFLALRRKEHHDARHNCHAFILRGGVERYSDDGEPQGTAGVPILEVLRKNGVCNLMVVVTRYFGGILLGAGGLVRAYSHAAALSVKAAGIVEITPWTCFSLEVDYGFYGKLTALMESHGARVTGSEFGAFVSLSGRIPEDYLEAFQKDLTEASAGGVALSIFGQTYAEL